MASSIPGSRLTRLCDKRRSSLLELVDWPFPERPFVGITQGPDSPTQVSAVFQVVVHRSLVTGGAIWRYTLGKEFPREAYHGQRYCEGDQQRSDDYSG